ncbi:helix-turn-helix transcriptional regulator [Pararhodobacter sp.]|uniref:helix-turn-helix transcriptional regulator n=1 Tax=Pararhodobacter sp. TaxID=2127056 RepID=UPI002FDDAC2D
MLDDVTAIRAGFAAQPCLEARVDEAFRHVAGLGFDGMIYDFTPAAPHQQRGTVRDPALLALRNVDEGMRDLWFAGSYFQIDPVQRVAVTTTVPFCWSYDDTVESVITPHLTEETRPVCQFLREREVFSGVTIPIHLPGGDFATVTGVGLGRRVLWDHGEGDCIAALSLLAQLFHQSAAEFLAPEPTRAIPHLTPRETECLLLTAEGLSAKEISRALDRAEATVVMHINAAMRKLGARNRVHAVTLATRHGLI